MRLDLVLSRLRARLVDAGRGESARLQYGIIDTVMVLLQHFPCRRLEESVDDDEDLNSRGGSWNQDDIEPFIIAGLDSASGPRVRSGAVELAVIVFSMFGLEAMEPMLQCLRPAKQTLLRDRFQEEEDESALSLDDGEDLPACELLVTGTAIRPHTRHMPLPGCLEEDILMDGILEDVGQVFCGTGIDLMMEANAQASASLGESCLFTDMPEFLLEGDEDDWSHCGLDLETSMAQRYGVLEVY
jgi:hypothetical protein